mgnify:CR=1 FL=1
MVESQTLLELGIGNLHRNNYIEALHYFEKACSALPHDHPRCAYYQSFIGLAKVLQEDMGGLETCRLAADRYDRDPDIWCNLAKSEFHIGNRRRAFDAINKGLSVSPHHTELKVFKYLIDSRRRPVIEFLSRDNGINRMLGKISYRLGPNDIAA